MPYQVVKTYGHEEGWSCTFRQWRAEGTHCHFIHGYPLSFAFTFECDSLDSRNWVIDFGGLKPLKAWLQSKFDHKMLVAEDDPKLDFMLRLQQEDLADVVVVPATSCEKFAEMAFAEAEQILEKSGEWPRVQLLSVKCAEHLGNSAVYVGEYE